MTLQNYLSHMSLIIAALKGGRTPGISNPLDLVHAARELANATLGRTNVYGKVA